MGFKPIDLNLPKLKEAPERAATASLRRQRQRDQFIISPVGTPGERPFAGMVTSSPRKRLAVILNRESGTLANLGPGLVADELKSIFEGLGCEVSIQNLPGKEVSAAIKEARDGDAEAVIVGGGDGTVAAAATILSGQSKPLGILPLGTFNLAARDVGMPLD